MKIKIIESYVSKCSLICISCIAKFADFWWKNADVSGTCIVYTHVIHIFSESSLRKV